MLQTAIMYLVVGIFLGLIIGDYILDRYIDLKFKRSGKKLTVHGSLGDAFPADQKHWAVAEMKTEGRHQRVYLLVTSDRKF